jgi:hypothetical protein
MEFGYLMDDLKELGAIKGKASTPRDGSWKMTTAIGNIVETKTLEDAMNIRTWKPDGIFIVEAGKVAWPSIRRLIGRASAKDAFWFMSGTFENSFRWYQDWFKTGQRPNVLRLESASLPTYTNEFNYEGGINNSVIQEMKQLYDEDYFREHVEGQPGNPHGLVLKSFQPQNVKDSELDLTQPVYCWVDPGYGSAYAIEVFQIEGNIAYGVDEVYDHGLTTEEMIAKCKERPWWNCKKIFTGDFAARQHHANQSVTEQWWELGGVRLHDMGKPIAVRDVADRIATKLKSMELFLSPKQVGALAETDAGNPPWQGHRAWKYRTDNEGSILDHNSTEGNRDAWMAIGYGLIRHFGFAPRIKDYHPQQYAPSSPTKYTNAWEPRVKVG